MAMKRSLFAVAAASSLLFATSAFSTEAPDQADFVNAWHGLGGDHQANNNPGDTADDRHNFDDATAGKSGQNPTARSNQPA